MEEEILIRENNLTEASTDAYIADNLWVRLFNCPTVSDASPLDIIRVHQNGCFVDERERLGRAFQWGLMVNSLDEVLRFVLLCVPNTKEYQVMNLSLALLTDHTSDTVPCPTDRKAADVPAPTNPITRVIADSLSSQDILSSIVLEEQIVEDDIIFTFVRLLLKENYQGYVLIDGETWVKTLCNMFKCVGLEVRTFEVTHSEKEWSSLSCFVKCWTPPVRGDTATSTTCERRQKPHFEEVMHTAREESESVTPTSSTSDGFAGRWLYWGVGSLFGAAMSYYLSTAEFNP